MGTGPGLLEPDEAISFVQKMKDLGVSQFAYGELKVVFHIEMNLQPVQDEVDRLLKLPEDHILELASKARLRAEEEEREQMLRDHYRSAT